MKIKPNRTYKVSNKTPHTVHNNITKESTDESFLITPVNYYEVGALYDSQVFGFDLNLNDFKQKTTNDDYTITNGIKIEPV